MTRVSFFRVGLLTAVSFAVAFTALGQEYAVEDDDLAPAGKAVVAAVRADRKCPECQKCSLLSKAIDLTKSGAKDTYFVTTVKGCAWNATIGPIWIVQGAKILLSDSGASLIVGRTLRNGLPELVTDASTEGKEEIRHFEYDGAKYTPAPTSTVEK